MARWFGPREECGCCEVRCGCENDSTLSSPSFNGTPTFRIVISGLPATYAWSDFIGKIFFFEKNDWSLGGLSGGNGTYFVELEKRNAFCIDETATPGFATTIGYTESYDRFISNSGDICTIVSSSSASAMKTLSFSVAASLNIFSLIIAGGLSDYYGIRGQVEMFCPTYDIGDSVANNSLNAGVGATKTWPRASGDIKIVRRAISTSDCGYTLEDASGEIFETIGSITVELLDL